MTCKKKHTAYCTSKTDPGGGYAPAGAGAMGMGMGMGGMGMMGMPMGMAATMGPYGMGGMGKGCGGMGMGMGGMGMGMGMGMGAAGSANLPPIVGLSIDPGSSIAQEGYPTDVPGIEYDKSCEVFSDAHHVLQDFFPNAMVKEACTFEHDPDCTQYPEVYQAWKAAGQADNCPMVAKAPSLGQWAVGFGGKANAERAAKLALALACASVADPGKVGVICRNYPNFGALCRAGGLQV